MAGREDGSFCWRRRQVGREGRVRVGLERVEEALVRVEGDGSGGVFPAMRGTKGRAWVSEE